MTSSKLVVALVALVVLTSAACGSTDSTDNPAIDAAPPVDDQLTQTDVPTRVAEPTDAEEAYREYEAADRLPVSDGEGSIVGYMNYTEYYSGDQDPVLIEVRSNEDDSLIGYRLRFIGFVPLDELAGEGSIEKRVSEMFGEQQAEAQAYLDEVNEKINSLTAEELRALETESSGS